MTRHRFLLFLLPLVLFVLVVYPATVNAQWRTMSRDMGQASPSVAPVGFGSLFAGSWLGEGSFALDFNCDGAADTPPNPPFTDAHTFAPGGSHLATNPANPNSGNGTWEKTGPRQIISRNVTFINILAFVNELDPDTGDILGLVQVPTNQLNLIAMITLVVDFDMGFETATTTFGSKLYLPTQDPLDPTEVPLICTVGVHDSFRKVSATE